ncbi:MAG: mechanosensitive ion channel [Acidobacteria bacterium]|nr:mechanosensitive ion channel [Acidobacteriota bacterium]
MRPAPRSFSLLLLALGVLLAAGVSATADSLQESASSESRKASETPVPAAGSPSPVDERSPADRTPDELTDVERLLRMQQAVSADEEKLARLRDDMTRRQEFLDLLTSQMATFQQTHDELEGRLAELDPDSEEAAGLQDDIERLEQQYGRFNRHAGLTFEAEGVLRRQISSLEEKIDLDRRALAMIRPEAYGVEQPFEPAPARSPQAPPAESTTPAAGLSPIPGVPLPAPSAPSRSAEAVLGTDTPEQIAARQRLERKREVARRAEMGVVTFVERKEAVEVQIGLEEELLRVDGETLENLRGYVAERQKRYDERARAGAPAADLAERRAQLERLNAEIARVEGEVARRRIELDSLRERLTYATDELNRVTDIAEERREEAESAQQWLVWIESPLYPANMTRWAVERGPRVLAVLLLAGLLLLFIRFSLRRIARAVVTKSRKARASAVNRADTLALSFQSLATTLILAACVLLVLQEAGLDVKTVLGGAAILGVAVAFGAQNLMRDYFTGFMMLLEDQYELGDLVTIGSITGTVERVNMRVTMLRDLEGRVHFIPNGQIGSLTNRTYDWARALVEIPVSPTEDVDRVMSLLMEVANGLKADPVWADEIVDEPQMLGVDKFTESGVVVKLMLKTQPERMFPVRRELLRRVKKAFDAAGIEPGFPQRVVRQRPTTEG